MWIALNKSFLSIVQPKQRDYVRWMDEVASAATAGFPNSAKHMLCIRSRSASDLRKALPDNLHDRIVEWPGRDYPARVMVSRDFAANLIAASVRGIGYENFKDSVRDTALHDAYMDVWSAMYRYGRGGYDRKPAPRRPNGKADRAARQAAASTRALHDTLDPYGDEPGLDFAPRSARGMPGSR